MCGYDSRAVLTEFGVPMNTGVNYDGARDGTNDVSYLYALTDTVRNMGMGSILWAGLKFASQSQGPGPCENASCAITSLQGSAPNYTLSINNKSGLDRLQYGWGGVSGSPSPSPSTSQGSPSPSPSQGSPSPSTGASGALHAVGAGKCLDVPGQSTTAGTQLEIYTCNGGVNQVFTHTSSGALTVYSGSSQLCLDAYNNGTSAGTKVETWTCNGGANQQWNLNANGTITGAQSGLCLDVTGGSTANGALVELWTCTGGANQQWKLG